MRRGAVLSGHGFIEIVLLLFREIGKLHSGTKGDLELVFFFQSGIVNQVENFRNEYGYADEPLNLGIAIWRIRS